MIEEFKKINVDCKQLGKTGEKVFFIVLGTYGHGGAYGGISRQDSFKILDATVKSMPDYANLLVYTAPHYGAGMCEKWIGEFLAEFDVDNILIATKGGRHIESNGMDEKDFSLEFLKAELDKSLKRLRTSEIFLYQLHNPSLETLIEGSVFDLLEEFRDAGKIKFYGVSIDSSEEGIVAIDVCRRRGYSGLASIQVIYNILNKAASEKLFRIANESGIGIIAREPLFRGFLTDKHSCSNPFFNVPPARKKEINLYGWEQIRLRTKEIQQVLQKYEIDEPLSKIAIKFAISHPHVTLAIPGTNRREYVESNLSAANIALDKELLSELSDITDITSSYKPAVFTKDLPTSVENSYRHAIDMAS